MGSVKTPPLKGGRMGIVLYKPGTTKKVRGIPCEFKVFDENYYLSSLDLGWYLSPEECYPKPKKIPKKKDSYFSTED